MSPDQSSEFALIIGILVIGGLAVLALDYWASRQTRIRIRGRILTVKKILAIIIMFAAMSVILRIVNVWIFLDNQQSTSARAAEVFLLREGTPNEN